MKDTIQDKIAHMQQMLEALSKGETDISASALDELKDSLNDIFAKSCGISDKCALDIDIDIGKMTRAVEMAPTAIVLTDLDGMIEYVNPAFLDMGGFQNASEVFGRSVFDFTDDEGKTKLTEEIIPVLNSAGKWLGEMPVRNKAGKAYFVEMICALIEDDKGQPGYFLVNFYNITDRKLAEEALLLDESRLEALLKLNQMDEATIQEITDFALEAGVKLTGSKLGYLAFTDDEERTLVMHSWSENALEECSAHKKIVYPVETTGLWGEALRQRKAIITNDYEACNLKKGLPEGHVKVLRHMNVPVFDKGKVVAVAGVGNKGDEYDDSDVRQLTLLMSGMWKIIQRKKSEEELLKRDCLLQGVASATNYLLTSDPQAILKAMGILGEAADVDRVFILENFESKEGEHHHRLLVEWAKDGIPSYKENVDLDSISFKSHFPGWYEVLASGRPLHGMADEIIEDDKVMLNKPDIASFLLIPIFIDGKFSSIIGFDDCRNSRLWMDNEIAVLQAAAGSIGEAIVRRRTEEALKSARDELEKRVEERTAWLLKANEALHEEMAKHKKTESELRRARKSADAASQAKSEFLANMSHEIRTPMNAVIGMSGLLLGTDLSPEQRDYIETIRSSGDALLAIINDILDFSKIDGGKMEIEHIPFDLEDCIESSLDLVAAKAGEKGLMLSYRLDDRLPKTIEGDATRLRQVLVNMLDNAVKFTDRGEVSVTVLPGSSSGEVHFAVRDSGIGISEESMGKLFLSFSQVDTSTSRKYGGTGLGLAISKRLVGLMGGRIWAESEEGIGSTFHFTIQGPAADARLTDSRLLGEKHIKTAARPPSSRHARDMRILLAEDNLVNQKVALLMLKRLGHIADVAANGLEVLEALERQSYDIILMDVQMPEMDGLETASRILQMKLERRPRILAMTAYALEGDREKCLDAGMDGYISKPVQIDELEAALEGRDGANTKRGKAHQGGRELA